MKFLSQRYWLGLALIATVWFLPGCSSVVPLAFLKEPTGYLTNAIEQHPDAELVRAAMPPILLALDGALQSAPNDPKLLLAATSAYGTYCQAFLADETQADRAANLYGHALHYGLRLLEHDLAVGEIRNLSLDDFTRSLQKTRQKDVPTLFAVGSVWIGWIMTNTESMAAIADLGKAIALLDRVLVLDETYNHGAVHIAFGIYYAAQPRGAGQDLEKSRFHFDRAMALAGAGNLMPRVMYAEFYARAQFDEELFEQTLAKVVEGNISEYPEFRLLNGIAIQRALRLLQRKEDLF